MPIIQKEWEPKDERCEAASLENWELLTCTKIKNHHLLKFQIWLLGNPQLDVAGISM